MTPHSTSLKMQRLHVIADRLVGDQIGFQKANDMDVDFGPFSILAEVRLRHLPLAKRDGILRPSRVKPHSSRPPL